MKKRNLARLISIKSEELTKMAIIPTASLLDKNIYEKSCQLDKLVVRYMKIAR